MRPFSDRCDCGVDIGAVGDRGTGAYGSKEQPNCVDVNHEILQNIM